MRWTIAAAALLAATPLAAEDVAIDSAVYRETAGADGAREVSPAKHRPTFGGGKEPGKHQRKATWSQHAPGAKASPDLCTE